MKAENLFNNQQLMDSQLVFITILQILASFGEAFMGRAGEKGQYRYIVGHIYTQMNCNGLPEEHKHILKIGHLVLREVGRRWAKWVIQKLLHVGKREIKAHLQLIPFGLALDLPVAHELWRYHVARSASVRVAMWDRV